jgi:hypothetical protein
VIKATLRANSLARTPSARRQSPRPWNAVCRLLSCVGFSKGGLDMPANKQKSATKGRWGSRRTKVNGGGEPQSRRAHKTEGSNRVGRASRRAKA